MKDIPQKGSVELRAFAMPDLRAVADGGNVVEGHAAVFGQRANIGGYFWEVVERGAFDKTDFKDVLYSACNHDAMVMRRIPLARSRNNNANSTLQLKVDDQGLWTRASLDVERNAEARALYSAVERGDIGGMSVAMLIGEDRWVWPDERSSEMPVRYILQVSRVMEVTPASLPAYEGTDINTRDQHALESAARTLESARSGLESRQSEQARRQTEIRELKDALLGRKG